MSDETCKYVPRNQRGGDSENPNYCGEPAIYRGKKRQVEGEPRTPLCARHARACTYLLGFEVVPIEEMKKRGERR